MDQADPLRALMLVKISPQHLLLHLPLLILLLLSQLLLPTQGPADNRLLLAPTPRQLLSQIHSVLMVLPIQGNKLQLLVLTLVQAVNPADHLSPAQQADLTQGHPSHQQEDHIQLHQASLTP